MSLHSDEVDDDEPLLRDPGLNNMAVTSVESFTVNDHHRQGLE